MNLKTINAILVIALVVIFSIMVIPIPGIERNPTIEPGHPDRSLFRPFDEADIGQLAQALDSDETDDHEYVNDTYTCVHFSVDLAHNLTDDGFRCGCAMTEPSDEYEWGHLLTTVYLDNETLYVDGQNDIVLNHTETVERYAPANVVEITTEYVEKAWYNETTPATVRDFLSIVPPCPDIKDTDINRCVRNSRYLAFEAQKHNITLGTCIICSDCVDGTMAGHQINTFEYEGTQYYTDNKNRDQSDVYTYGGLLQEINDWQGLKLTSLGMHDYWYPK